MKFWSRLLVFSCLVVASSLQLVRAQQGWNLVHDISPYGSITWFGALSRDTAYLTWGTQGYAKSNDGGKSWNGLNLSSSGYHFDGLLGGVRIFDPIQPDGLTGVCGARVWDEFYKQDNYLAFVTKDEGTTWFYIAAPPPSYNYWDVSPTCIYGVDCHVNSLDSNELLIAFLHSSGYFDYLMSPIYRDTVKIDNSSSYIVDFIVVDPREDLLYLKYQKDSITQKVQLATIDSGFVWKEIKPVCTRAAKLGAHRWIGVDDSNRIWRTEAIDSGWQPTYQVLPIKNVYGGASENVVYASLNSQDSMQYRGKLAVSTDFGSSWQLQSLEDTVVDVHVTVIDDTVAWLYTSTGHVYRALSSGFSDVPKNVISNSMRVNPNPASHGIVVSLQNVTPNCKLEMFNTLGANVRTMNPTIGQSSYEFNVADLPSGLYLIRYGSESQKVMIVTQ